jgi:hypothetical protein
MHRELVTTLEIVAALAVVALLIWALVVGGPYAG